MTTVELPEQSRWVTGRLLKQLKRLDEDIPEVEQQLIDVTTNVLSDHYTCGDVGVTR